MLLTARWSFFGANARNRAVARARLAAAMRYHSHNRFHRWTTTHSVGSRKRLNPSFIIGSDRSILPYETVQPTIIKERKAVTNASIIITMSSRARNKAALAKFREDKRKRLMGEEEPDFEIKEEEDVYDIVDENEYQTLVNSRRQREDFVVDDGTLVSESLLSLSRKCCSPFLGFLICAAAFLFSRRPGIL